MEDRTQATSVSPFLYNKFTEIRHGNKAALDSDYAPKVSDSNIALLIP